MTRLAGKARGLGLFICILTSAGCGSNYVVSAYAPQLASRCNLSATQLNVVILFGNIGVYFMSPLAGFLVDHKGVKPGLLLACICLFIGYGGLYRAYTLPEGWSAFWLCLCMLLTGIGSTCGFLSCMNAATKNFPRSRGSATAGPLAAFGLSSAIFSTISTLFFGGDAESLLLLLTFGTTGLCILGLLFIRVLADSELSTAKINGSRPPSPFASSIHSSQRSIGELDESSVSHQEQVDDGESRYGSLGASSRKMSNETLPDMRGRQLLGNAMFWMYFLIMTLLAGSGLHLINNVGLCVRALWSQYYPHVTENQLHQAQGLQVSLISIASCVCRILSGIGSDVLKTRGHSRSWMLVISAVLFFISQFTGHSLSSPHGLYLVSLMTGAGYGALFGPSPTIVSEAFGIPGMSQNWGFMTISAVVGSYVFNTIFGRIFDAHSKLYPDGQRSCREGGNCFRTSFAVTAAASFLAIFLGIVVSLRKWK